MRVTVHLSKDIKRIHHFRFHHFWTCPHTIRELDLVGELPFIFDPTSSLDAPNSDLFSCNDLGGSEDQGLLQFDDLKIKLNDVECNIDICCDCSILQRLLVFSSRLAPNTTVPSANLILSLLDGPMWTWGRSKSLRSTNGIAKRKMPMIPATRQGLELLPAGKCLNCWSYQH